MKTLEWIQIEVGSSIDFPVWGAKDGETSYIITLEHDEIRASYKDFSAPKAIFFNDNEPLPSIDVAMALCEMHRRGIQ